VFEMETNMEKQNNSAPADGSNKKKKILTIVGSVAATVIIYFVIVKMLYVETDNAQIEAHAVLIAPKVGGYVSAVKVKDGSKVKKDESLIQLDDRDYQVQLESAKSELLSLGARMRDAEKNFSRIRDLFSKSVVSQQQFDSASANFNEIKGKYDSAKAKVDQANLNLEHAQIKAPSDGVIAKISAEVGQLANVGVPLVGFVGSESRWVTANFKETEIYKVKVGHFVKVTVDAIPGKSFEGEVESISSATGATFTLLPPDNATGNFTKVVQRVPVRIKLNLLSSEDIDALHAGLSAIVRVSIH